MEIDLELFMEESGKFLYFNYDEEEFRRKVSNVNPSLTVMDLNKMVDHLFRRIEKYNKEHLAGFDWAIDYFLAVAKKDLKAKIIRTYYSSWLVLEYNQQ
jgi:hypothetical protein